MHQTDAKVYLAAPFFNEEQLRLVEELEELIRQEGYELFSPRLAAHAQRMNGILKAGGQPSGELREKVFEDNWENINTADLVIAVIDNFDVGVMWEVGYAYAKHVPVVTYTAHDYGCNLMLAHSIVGHVKSLEAAREVLQICKGSIAPSAPVVRFAEAIAKVQAKFRTPTALKEGPDERNQFKC